MDWHKFNELSILIIDDDQFSRELVKTILKKVPTITVHMAVDGIEALMMIEKHDYDMFLVDLYMPKMDGEKFVSHLRKDDRVKNLPVVLITTDRLVKKELTAIGINYYLTKPLDFQNFLKSIYNFFEKELILNET